MKNSTRCKRSQFIYVKAENLQAAEQQKNKFLMSKNVPKQVVAKKYVAEDYVLKQYQAKKFVAKEHVANKRIAKEYVAKVNKVYMKRKEQKAFESIRNRNSMKAGRVEKA